MAAKAGVVHRDSSDSEVELSWAADRGPTSGSVPGSQVIHSGHFMVSSPHSDTPQGSRTGEGLRRYDFDTVNRTWCQTYRFGPRSTGSLSIDPTISRLFECMSLAYSGNIVSPKWKSFKGLRLLWRDKIRLNNAIWRAWFIQYVEKKKSPVCGFVTPLEGLEADAHRKPEAIVLEGSYWKRRIEVVIKEYHKWRIYHKKRLQKKKDDILSMLREGPICQVKLEKWSAQTHQEPAAAPAEAHMFDLDCFLSDISDTLFTMTQKQCPWTSNRHNTYTSNADIIQPGLTPLQPNVDDFMDIPDIFMNFRGQPTETSGFADCGYFESSSTVEFAPVPPEAMTPQLVIDNQLTQPRLSSASLPELLSVTLRDDTKSSPVCRDYQSSGVMPGVLLFGQQSFADPPVSAAFTSNIQQPVSSSTSLMYPLPCNKFDYCAEIDGTSSVITRTASSTGSAQPTQSYPHMEDTYSHTLCHSLAYPQAHMDPPSEPATHCFPVPEHVTTRGKHKQKRDGGWTSAHPLAPSGRSSITPSSTSCLAKLLSTNSRSRKLSLGFKGQRSSSPGHLSSTSVYGEGASPQAQHGGGWHGGVQTIFSPLSDHGSTTGHSEPQASTSRGSAVSARFNHGSTPTSTSLIVPKTEKLSPVPLYSHERTSLSAHFPAYHGQGSPPYPLDRPGYPDSPHSGYSGLAKLDSSKQVESRRITHISAEQKRRFNIKLGFDTLHNLVTTLSSQPSIKISKATTLQKTAEYISKMQRERAQLHEEAQKLRQEIQQLNSAINTCQLQLPATGVPITRQRFDHMRQKFREYVQAQTLQNWKFWIFSIIIEPLFESYNGMVSTASVEDLCQSTLSWLEQHCSLPAIRPMALRSLRLLSTTTAILTDPGVLPEQATLAVTQGDPAIVLDHTLQPSTQDNIQTM
ncbi:carbohydrate-responsive element-binding protein isoform 1-T1 [Synchiropus picturatus]